MTAEQEPDELNLGLLCFIGARAVETRVLEALAAAGYDDITPSGGARFERGKDPASEAQSTGQGQRATADVERRSHHPQLAPWELHGRVPPRRTPVDGPGPKFSQPQAEAQTHRCARARGG